LSPVFITIGRIRFTPIIASLCPNPPIKVIRRKCAERFSALSKTPGGKLGMRADRFGWPVEFKEFKSVVGVEEGVLFGETLKYVGWITLVNAKITKTTVNTIIKTPMLKKTYPVVLVPIKPS